MDRRSRVCWLKYSFTIYWGKKFVRKLLCWTWVFYQWFIIAVYHKSIIVRRSTVFLNWVTLFTEHSIKDANQSRLFKTLFSYLSLASDNNSVMYSKGLAKHGAFLKAVHWAIHVSIEPHKWPPTMVVKLLHNICVSTSQRVMHASLYFLNIFLY